MIKTFEDKGWSASPWRAGMWAAIVVVLAAPLVAMQFTAQVAWTVSDFELAALLLVGAGLIYELVASSPLKRPYKAAVGGMLVAMVLVIWAEGAVGIFS